MDVLFYVFVGLVIVTAVIYGILTWNKKQTNKK